LLTGFSAARGQVLDKDLRFLQSIEFGFKRQRRQTQELPKLMFLPAALPFAIAA